jgi:chaperonin cofactor prefoldin
MLAIEDKKMESLTKRIDVLKWSMLSKGKQLDVIKAFIYAYIDMYRRETHVCIYITYICVNIS